MIQQFPRTFGMKLRYQLWLLLEFFDALCLHTFAQVVLSALILFPLLTL